MTEITKGKVCIKLSEFAVESMLYEVACYPSFGLVSPISNGSHTDMDFFTFINSTTCLAPFMYEFANKSYNSEKPKDVFREIRLLGIKAEKLMYKKTKNVNTHKGMIFTLGLCVAAASKCIYNKRDFTYIKNTIKNMTTGIVEKELYNIRHENLSNGEKTFLKYGHTGIRGEAEAGFPIIFDLALHTYEGCYDLSENDRLVQTLITIMQYTEDSTILYRHNADILKEVQGICKYIIEIGGMYSERGRQNINAYSNNFENRNISPGGSADLLACTVFLSKVKKLFFSKL